MAFVRASDLARRLADLRATLGLTQEAFGELMGVVDQSVSDYETGRSQPSVSRLRRLASRLQIPDAVFQEGGPMPSTLPIRPVETRTAPGPTPGAVHPADLLRRLAFFRAQLESYRALGQPPSPAVIADWLDLLADLEDARNHDGTQPLG